MRKNDSLNYINAAKIISSRLFSEKTLLTFFAASSLAFGLFYTFANQTATATANDGAMPMLASTIEDTESLNAPREISGTAAVSDVVTKALAFKALLTTTQQATLEKTYTTALARRWSNLPCGSNCRNGIQFSTLTADQLTAALAVIQAAAGTTANEGYNEFLQVRAAEEVLQAQAGGNNYDEGIYFISFLNTPTTTGAWMLQYGGHHYAANISYNAGHVVGTTPVFEGVEPISYTATVNGTTGTYTPITQERNAMANMLASFTTAQLTTARLSNTFSDVTLAPGESNGGSGTFPATKVGIPGSSLTDAQKLLVLAAIQPYTQDMDDTVATNLLAIYQNELNGTYVGFSESTFTQGSATTFLNANTDYIRIDGPTVWIEFVCQNGVVFSGIHYHSVWRDHARDYGADLSLTTALDNSPTAAAVSITGRVFTPEGRGLRNARVLMTDARAETRVSTTNAFGYYRFAELAAGETYVVQVASKRYSFGAQIVSVTEELTDLNFTANQ